MPLSRVASVRVAELAIFPGKEYSYSRGIQPILEILTLATATLNIEVPPIPDLGLLESLSSKCGYVFGI